MLAIRLMMLTARHALCCYRSIRQLLTASDLNKSSHPTHSAGRGEADGADESCQPSFRVPGELAVQCGQAAGIGKNCFTDDP